MKTKTIYVCQGCGYQSAKWLGRCPDCNQWNTIQEEVSFREEQNRPRILPQQGPSPLHQVEVDEGIRIKTGITELDRILGGGIVPGSVVLIGGDPGIGKSTLLLQASERLSQGGNKILYVSGEESVRQTKLRANRLGTNSKNLYIVNETNLEFIKDYISKLRPKAVIIDSIQVIYTTQLPSSPGSVGQIRECAGQLSLLAKATDTCCLLIGHVTKEGVLAGPRLLEHLVDTVLYFEGDRFTSFKILRAVKNRFGATNEIGVFEMTGKGLAEILSPSSAFLAERPKQTQGSTVVATIEGSRPLLVEIQALVSQATFGMPSRRSTGLDYNKVSLLIAVLEKRVGLTLGNYDVFVNVAGGIKVLEPAVDLGVVVAIASSLKERSTSPHDVIFGEVGLGGEVRGVSHIQARLAEVSKLGFTRCVIPKNNIKSQIEPVGLELVGVETVKEALDVTLERR